MELRVELRQDPGTDKERLNRAFKELRRKGYIARQNFMCCGGCASAAIADDVQKKGGNPDTAKAVFYHQQDTEHAFPREYRRSGWRNIEFVGEGMISKNGLYINWQGDADEIIEALNDAGLMTAWDGKAETRIKVTGSHQ